MVFRRQIAALAGGATLRPRAQPSPTATLSMASPALASLVNIAPGAVPRNQGLPLELGWVNEARVNLSAVERRVATLPGRRTVKKDAQAGWLLKAVTCIDLTALSGDDTTERVRRLCAKAKAPVRADLLEALGFADRTLTTGA